MKFNSLMKIGLLVILIALILWVGTEYRDSLNFIAIHQTVQKVGRWAPIIFILIYVLATVCFLPGLVVTIAGGLLFGLWWGTLYNIMGAVIGATCSFYISRYIAADWVNDRVGGKLKMLVDGVNKQGWKFIALVRLVPLLPFNLLNYALGLTRISGFNYAWASAVLMLPGTFAYTYAGALGEQFIAGGGQNKVTKVMLGIGLLILIALIPWFMKKYKQYKS